MREHALDRLAKVLELTTSNRDGEALAAVRKANEMRGNLGSIHGYWVRNGYLTPKQASTVLEFCPDDVEWAA